MKKNHSKFIMGAILAASVLIAPKACFAESVNANDLTKYNYKGNLYSVVDDAYVKSLDDMKAYAESLGGHLVYINNEDENTFVSKLIEESGSKLSYVLGIHRDKESREWKYDNGEKVSYTNWAPGEPNRDDEDYVHMYTSTGKWNNTVNIPRGDYLYKLGNMGMVIEWEGECVLNGHSYKIIDDADVKSLDDMKAYAKKLGGHLAYINDEEESDFLVKLIQEKGSKLSYVLGMYRDKESREWKYDNGEKVSYTNWAPGEPNRDDEDYVHMYTSTGKWNNTVNVPRGDNLYKLGNMGMVVEWD